MCKLDEQAAKRLAGYERLYADLLAEQAKILADMEALRGAGRVKSATYQQLIANKLTVQNLIGRFAIYGITRESTKEGVHALLGMTGSGGEDRDE